MYKLNNRGFGMTSMIAFIIVFALILIGIMAVASNAGIEKNSKNPALKKEENMFVSPEKKEE